MPLSPRVGKAREKGQRATGTQVSSFCTELLGGSKAGTEGILGGIHLFPHPHITWGVTGGGMVSSSQAMPSPYTPGLKGSVYTKVGDEQHPEDDRDLLGPRAEAPCHFSTK